MIQGQCSLQRAAGHGLERAHVCLFLGLAAYAFGCSGSQFATGTPQGGAGGAGAANSSGAANNAGSGNVASGGDLNTAGDPTSGGGDVALGGASTGGTVAMGGAPCNCASHQYCRDGSTDCYDCSSTSRMNFTAPERLATLEGDVRYPRSGNTPTDLFYADAAGLHYTSDFATSAGKLPSATLAGDVGPLLASNAIDASALPGAMLKKFNFFFERKVDAFRRLFIADWQGGVLAAPEQAPSPLNGATNDYSPALAQPQNASPRLYWISDRALSAELGAAPRLVMSLLDGKQTVATRVNLSIGVDSCAASEADLSPWVTSDGKMLLLSHSRRDSSCAALSPNKEIYAVLLSPTDGQPSAPARPMNDVNSGMDDVDPSFSADMCDLYFASNRDGKYAIYRAHRR